MTKRCVLEQTIKKYGCLGCPLPLCIKDIPGKLSKEDDRLLHMAAKVLKKWKWNGTVWVKK